ncbi:MAG: FMN-binding protein [Gammaproteobacteria bacterium]|nr:FMN-binding protein [Gammaproteobacteria bacterium]
MKYNRWICIPLLWIAAGISTNSLAKGVYQEPQEFIHEVFAGNPPPASRLWIRKDLEQEINTILGHDLGVLRLHYWARDGRTAWILEEIGKERPITTGVVVNQGRIELVRILIFRESRGWEVRYPFFTDQFNDAGLVSEHKLDKSIDGISGATLSVNAVTKLARLALLLHGYIENGEDKS